VRWPEAGRWRAVALKVPWPVVAAQGAWPSAVNRFSPSRLSLSLSLSHWAANGFFASINHSAVDFLVPGLTPSFLSILHPHHVALTTRISPEINCVFRHSYCGCPLACPCNHVTVIYRYFVVRFRMFWFRLASFELSRMGNSQGGRRSGDVWADGSKPLGSTG
jgi:hypothetical protein